jgi:hypothetical protein
MFAPEPKGLQQGENRSATARADVDDAYRAGYGLQRVYTWEARVISSDLLLFFSLPRLFYFPVVCAERSAKVTGVLLFKPGNRLDLSRHG